MTRVASQATDFDGSVAGQIERALADRIVSGALAPGDRLMQDHVALEFGASHVPVREAFRKLEAQGLLVSKPRCGVRVSALEPAAILEVTEMRAALEGLALSHALPLLGENDLAAAERALREGEASDQIADWEAANRHFHLALTNPCGMPRLMATIADLHRCDARFLFATWRHLDWQPRSDAEHWTILEAIKRSDRERACDLLTAHIKEAGTALADQMRRSGENVAA
jgi:DNA-binding GntR family transcriptional regulator